MFEARAARLDHEGTQAVVSVLRALDPEAAAAAGPAGRPGPRRPRQTGRACRAVARPDRHVAAGRAAHRRRGTRGRGGGAAPHRRDRRDFDRIGRELDALRARLDEWCKTSIQAAREALDEARQTGDLRTADTKRIEDHIKGRDLTTAREFIAQLKAGKQLPEKAESLDFAHFYPAFPDVFHRHSRQTGKRARKQETSGYIDALKDALIVGRDVAEPELYDLLATVGIDIPQTREASRRVAGRGCASG